MSAYDTGPQKGHGERIADGLFARAGDAIANGDVETGDVRLDTPDGTAISDDTLCTVLGVGSDVYSGDVFGPDNPESGAVEVELTAHLPVVDNTVTAVEALGGDVPEDANRLTATVAVGGRPRYLGSDSGIHYITVREYDIRRSSGRRPTELCEYPPDSSLPCPVCFSKGHNTPRDIEPTPREVFGVDLTEGRLLYDTETERYCVVESVDCETGDVTVERMVEVPNGCDTPYGTVVRNGQVTVLNWHADGGRFIPQ